MQGIIAQKIELDIEILKDNWEILKPLYFGIFSKRYYDSWRERAEEKFTRTWR